MKRIFPYEKVKSINGWATPNHFEIELPAIVGQVITKKGKEILIWISIDGDLHTVKNRNEATICKTLSMLDGIVEWCGGYKGFRKIFVETLT